MLLSPSSRFGPYEVQAFLGAGGMGEVYRALDGRLGREVALKVLSPDMALSAGVLDRFEQEARAASALNHPSIVTIYDIGEADGLAYIAMELVEGRSLRDLISEGALSLSRALEIASRIAFGLARAHEAGIVHRDLKPENVMVGREGAVKVLDFGLAKLTGSLPAPGQQGQRLTSVGVVVGTPAYMSPEQARGAPVDYRSDQFSLGLVLYEMLTGSPAFSAGTAVELMTAIIQDEPPPLATVAPRVPAPVRWVVERCLHKDPDGRNASTRDLARELATLGQRLSEARSTQTALAPPPRSISARTLRLAAGALLCLAVGAAAGRFTRRPAEARVPSLLPLTHSGSDTAPAVSRDGRLVAFVSSRDGTPRVWLKVLAGGAEAPLSSGRDDYPRFSPDGSQVLFVREEGTRRSIYRVPVLGGEARKLVHDASSADWSPDGKTLAYVRWEESAELRESRIGLADADGGNERIVARITGRSALHPRWAPDGRHIAFLASALNDVSGALSVLDTNTLQVASVVVPTAGAHLSSVAWTPGSDALLFARSDSATPFVLNTNSAARILLQPLRGQKARTILTTTACGTVLDTAGPGRLVLEARSTSGALMELGLPEARSVRFLTRGSSADRQPVYSPSGDELLFSSNRTGDWDLWALSRKTESVKNLTDNRSDDWDPAFVGDGSRIVWSSNRSGHFEIWIANADGSGARRLTDDGVDAENPTATPDGRWVVYASSNPSKQGIWKVRDDGSETRRLVSTRAYLPEVSPDGRHVLFVSNTGAVLPPIRVARVEDGALVPFEIAPEPDGAPMRPVGRARWSADGKSIVFGGTVAGGRSAVFSQPFEPGKDTAAQRRTLIAFHNDATIETFGLSRDGARLVIGSLDHTSNLTIAEGLAGLDAVKRR